MIDWPEVYAQRVAPVLAAHRAPAPPAIRALAAAAVLAGGATVAFAPWPWGFAGFAPVLAVAFGAWAVRGNRRAAASGQVTLREGRVAERRVERILTDDTRTGASEAREVHVIVVDLTRAGTLTAHGAAWEPAARTARLTTSAELYADLAVGNALIGVSLPIAPRHVHLRVSPDGAVRG